VRGPNCRFFRSTSSTPNGGSPFSPKPPEPENSDSTRFAVTRLSGCH
jgi:hypothetical protein